MIRFEHVGFAYTKERGKILDDLSFTIEKGESVGIIGPNGAGKSTLLKLMVGLIFPQEGSIMIDSESVGKKNLAKIRQKIGYVFQDSDTQLFMPTVEADIGFGPKNYGLSTEEVKKRVEEALIKTGTQDLRSLSVLELSGGQKKLVSLATVLSLEPEVLLFDEPTIALDPKNRRRFIELFRELSGTKIIVTHDLDLILDTCSRTILLDEGKIVCDDETEKILYDQKLLEENGLELPLMIEGVKRRIDYENSVH